MSSASQNTEWKKIVRKYTTPDPIKSWWQVINTLVPLFTLWWCAYQALSVSIWLSLFIGILCQPFFVRAFIILHDCSHGTFFKSKRLRTIVGTICGILTFTPYKQWGREHTAHHQTSGNLDKRGLGDVWTITAKEYGEMDWKGKFAYHTFRFPIVNFIIGPFYIFQIRFRFHQRHDGVAEDRNRQFTNLALAVIIGTLCYSIGWKAFLAVHLPIVLFTNTLGTWLFFVQHQYEDTYWRKNEEWDYFEASMQGSSFLKLPKFFQWCTGNIGIHHIHHLSHQIPNYNLRKA
ncbi:MAG: fatty acid desaturase, partial [Halobacteriovoraceae bacterium]|nr:fatty acid desaturase [Halobacteriovoraceae bacterium]